MNWGVASDSYYLFQMELNSSHPVGVSGGIKHTAERTANRSTLLLVSENTRCKSSTVGERYFLSSDSPSVCKMLTTLWHILLKWHVLVVRKGGIWQIFHVYLKLLSLFSAKENILDKVK